MASKHPEPLLHCELNACIALDPVAKPLQLERDTPLLWEVYRNHPEVFQYMPSGPLSKYEDFFEKHAAESNNVSWACYVSAHPDAASEKKWVLCGSVSLLDISLLHRRFEIGSVWFHPEVHGTFVMLETIYALLRFSFERLQAGRVQWKTHHRNIASQKAAIKLGFSPEGVYRKHIIHADGTWRHSVYYSMTDDDWFGREETTDARPGLDVATEGKESAAMHATTDSQGLERKLEETIARRKREGKRLASSVMGGHAFGVIP
ncbi:acyl-CoA N-acyltransferase [Mortierella sp. GBAus27b]|nr:acyl-CoA N-acyltransferase [Mortierella sp. GBAus27b]